MNARLEEAGSNDIVLDVVQGELFPLDGHDFLLPGRGESCADVLDRCHRIMLENEIQSGRVVEIDPIRQGFPPLQSRRSLPLERSDVSSKRCQVLFVAAPAPVINSSRKCIAVKKAVISG